MYLGNDRYILFHFGGSPKQVLFSAGLFVKGSATWSSNLSTINRTVGPSYLPTFPPDIICFDLPTPFLQYCSRDEPSPRDQLPLWQLCRTHRIHSSPPFRPGICSICRLGGHQWVLAGCQGKIPVPASTASIELSFPGNVQVLLPHLPSPNTSRCQTAGLCLQDVWRQLQAVGHVSAPRSFEACSPFWAVFSKWHRQASPQCLHPWRRWRRPLVPPSSEWDRFFRNLHQKNVGGLSKTQQFCFCECLNLFLFVTVFDVIFCNKMFFEEILLLPVFFIFYFGLIVPPLPTEPEGSNGWKDWELQLFFFLLRLG